MNERTLQSFRDLGEILKSRNKMDITISFTKQDGGKGVINAKYDALFKTVELGNATVPAMELRQWLMLLYGADGKIINVSC